MTIVYTGFFGGPFFGGGFFDPGTQVGGHGSSEGAGEDGSYSEPRRVMIAGKPFTVRSKAEYFALLKRYGKKGSTDAARKQADQVIEGARVTAREALSQADIAETARLLQLTIEKQSLEAKRRDQELARQIEENAIPIQILMMVALDL